MKLDWTEIKASIYTAITLGVGLLLLILGSFSAKPKVQHEGVMISLCTDLPGMGSPYVAAPRATTLPQPQAPEVSPPAAKEELMTQHEASVDLAAAEAKKKKVAQDKALKEEQVRLNQARIAKEKKLAEEKRVAEEKRIAEEKRLAEEARLAAERQAKAEKANALGSAFGTKQQGEPGQGTTSGEAMSGNPVGKGTSNGHSWSLKGRNILGGIVQPTFSGNQSGKIVVSIRVDAKGQVVDASIATGTTISDETLRRNTLDSARKTKFSLGKSGAYGTIVYIYKLN